MDIISRKVEAFFAEFPERHYKKGELLVHAGEELPGVLYLTKGQVMQYDITEAGSMVVVNTYKPGAFFPMSWAINKQPNQYFFEAAEDTTVRQAPADKAVTFVRQEPDVLFDLLSRVYKGVDGVLRRLTHLMGGNAKSRLLFELINATLRFGQLQSDGGILVPLKEGDLAQRAGLARETVNRTMRQLKTDGALSVNHKGFIVHNLAHLQRTLGDAV